MIKITVAFLSQSKSIGFIFLCLKIAKIWEHYLIFTNALAFSIIILYFMFRIMLILDKLWDIAKLVRHQILTLESAGSSPAIPAILKKYKTNIYIYGDFLMDENLVKQLKNDFGNCFENLLDGKNYFVLNDSNIDFLTYNEHKLAINCVGNSLLVRSSNYELLEELKKEYCDYPAAWFMEVDNLIRLQGILDKYSLHLKNMAPVFTPSKDFKKIESTFELIRIYKKDLNSLKGISKYSFCFEKGYYEDKLGLACYDKGKLIALCGVNQNSKYLWEIGIEKFDYNEVYKNVASILVNNIVAIAREENPEITVIYSTQFSHVKSMNVATRAGFEFALSLIVAD